MRSSIGYLLIVCALFASAQKYKATSSHIRFFSDAPIEDIEAINEDAASVMDLETGSIVFSVPIKSFTFEKSLMQEHFNENYLESDKYPKCLFLGKMDKVQLKEGSNRIAVTGTLDLHGVKKELSVTGTMDKTGDRIEAKAVFTVLLEDYKIKIPRALFHNIAEEIEVTVNFTYEPN